MHLRKYFSYLLVLFLFSAIALGQNKKGLKMTKNNSEYAWANVSGQYVDAPSQESLQFYDRPHDLTFWLYTGLPFGINAALTAFYQSGGPYTPYIFAGKDPKPDEKNINTKRGPAFRNVNLNFNKYISIMDHRISVGLSVYNVLDIRNEVDVWPLTGNCLLYTSPSPRDS